MSAANQDHGAAPLIDTARLSESQGASLRMIGFTLAGIGVALGIAGYLSDRDHFLFSYLAGFTAVLTIALTALIFTIIQHLVRAKWSVAARRSMENMASFLPIAALLFIPIALGAHTIWHHWMGPDAIHDELLQKKAAYLNPPFFYGRAAFYFVFWTFATWFFVSKSLKQDSTGQKSLTLTMRIWSAPMILLMGLTLTFAGFDWLMGLDPHWYSTVFGVYVFSGGLQAMFALLAIITVVLQERGFYKRVSTVEHRHDIGKLLHGFTIFYAYIAFCQFFLIWYANIPEETIFFRHRWEESWKIVSLLLIFTRFVIPFWLLLPRTVKRHPVGICVGAGVVLLAHFVDHFWMVLPTIDEHAASFTWVNIAGLAAPVGLFLGWLGLQFSRNPLYPLKDPELKATYKNVNF